VAASLWAIIGATATLFVQAALNLFLEPLGLPALTAPFCITTWFFLLPMFKLGGEAGKEPDHSVWHHHQA
jgi:urea transporter